MDKICIYTYIYRFMNRKMIYLTMNEAVSNVNRIRKKFTLGQSRTREWIGYTYMYGYIYIDL